MKEKTAKYLNVSKCNVKFFFLGLFPRQRFEGMYVNLKAFFRRKYSYVPEFIENNLSFKVKSKSHI